MNTPVMFECEKCHYPITSKLIQPNGKVVCKQCGHENTPPKAFTPPESVRINVKKRYFGG